MCRRPKGRQATVPPTTPPARPLNGPHLSQSRSIPLGPALLRLPPLAGRLAGQILAPRALKSSQQHFRSGPGPIFNRAARLLAVQLINVGPFCARLAPARASIGGYRGEFALGRLDSIVIVLAVVVVVFGAAVVSDSFTRSARSISLQEMLTSGPAPSGPPPEPLDGKFSKAFLPPPLGKPAKWTSSSLGCVR